MAPPSSFTILAGASDVSKWAPGLPAPAGAQVVHVGSLRVHPYYDARNRIDDVMVLTLSSPLNLSGPNVKAIAIAPPTSAVPGTPLRVTGYGQSSTSSTDGKLRGAYVTAIADEDCPIEQPNNSAVVLCTLGANSASPCRGDSGGPLTTRASPAQQVGVVDFFPATGCATGPAAYTDLTAPEVRAFIAGQAAIPRAPRELSPALLSGVVPPVPGSPLVCSAGSWDGSPVLAYTFRIAGGAALQTGPGATYAPHATDIGKSLTCVVRATNPGGTSTARTGTTPPIQPDLVAPSSRIVALRCSRRQCRAHVLAFDPNSAGPVTVRASTRYVRRTRCSHGRRARASTRRCRRTAHGRATVRASSPGHFTVTVVRRRHRRAVLSIVAYDAAGNRQHGATRRTIRGR